MKFPSFRLRSALLFLLSACFATNLYAVAVPSSTAVAADSRESVYLADSATNSVRKIDAQGDISMLPFRGLNGPQAIALDAEDNVFVADTGNGRIVKMTPSGEQSVLPIHGLLHPTALAFDPARQNLYVLQLDDHKVRKFNLTTNATTLILTGVERLQSIAVDASGALYLGQHFSDTPGGLFKMTAKHVEQLDGFYSPFALVFDASGNLYVDDVIGLFRLNNEGARTLISLDEPVGAVAVDAHSLIAVGKTVTHIPTQTMDSPSSFAALGGVTPSVTGNGTLSVDARLKFFRDTPAGGTAPILVFTVSNTGTVTVNTTTLTLSDTTNFKETDTCINIDLVPGATCTVSLTFHPLTQQQFSTPDITVVSLNSDASNSPLQFQADGYADAANAPVSAISPDSVSFSSSQAQAASTQTIVVQNVGSGQLGVTAIKLVDFTNLVFPPSVFSETDDCTGRTLSAGETCSVVVSFNVRQILGGKSFTFTGSVEVDSSGFSNGNPGTTNSATLSAFVAGYPVPSASPASLAFNTTEGVAAANLGIYVANTGDAVLLINSAGFTGANPGAFAIASNSTCGSSVPAEGGCFYAISFPANAAGTYSANFVFTENANPANGTPASFSFPITANVTGSSISATLTPGALTFSAFTGTSSASQSATLTNTGSSSLTISSISLSGAGAGSFTQTNNCGTTVAIVTSCSIAVTFSPTGNIAASANLIVADNTGPSGATVSQTVALSGTITLSPQASLTPSSLTFTATAGTSAPILYAGLSNTGSAALTIASIAITGPNAQAFSQINNCGTSQAVGSNCIISISFSPAIVGALSATLIVTDNSGTSGQTVTQSITLTGTGVGIPQAVLTPSAVTFGSVLTGQSATQTLTLANPGTAALTITGITAGPLPFSSTGSTCGSTLAAGASCTITVSYSPTVAGAQTGAVTVTDSVGTQSATLTGTGTVPPPGPALSASASSLAFPVTAVGVSSASQPVTLTNTGGSTLTFTSINLTGTSATSFKQTSSSCQSSLAAGASCVVQLAFSPTASAATYNANLVVTSNATNSPTSVALLGEISAEDFTITADVTTVNVDSSGPGVVQLTLQSAVPGEPFNSSITLSYTGDLPAHTTASFSPASIAPGSAAGIVTLTLTYDQNAMLHPASRLPVPLACGLFGLLWMTKKRLPRSVGIALFCFALLAGTLTLAGCAHPTIKGTITAQSGNIQHSVPIFITNK